MVYIHSGVLFRMKLLFSGKWMKLKIMLSEMNQTQYNKYLPGLVAHACNPGTPEAEVGGSVSSRPVWDNEFSKLA